MDEDVELIRVTEWFRRQAQDIQSEMLSRPLLQLEDTEAPF